MFKKIENFFDSFYNAPVNIPAGIYLYQAPPESALPYKLHLRVEADGSGILIINAHTVLHLNQTAAEFAYHLMQGKDKSASAAAVAARYKIPLEIAQKDQDEFLGKIEMLVRPGRYPGQNSRHGCVAPYCRNFSAHFRMDCALTYRVSEGPRPPRSPPLNALAAS